jgi:hypothetical protein
MNIKRMSVWIGVAILLVLFASSCVSCPDPCPEYPEYPECEECPPSRECPICTKCPECFPCETKCIDQCFGFTDYKAGTNFSNQFGYYDVKFESIDGSDLEVWEVDGERSLHLPTAGIRIFLPCPAYEVLVRVGSWAGGPFNVTAYDGNKNMVDQVSVPGDNSFHAITLSGKDIQMVAITEVGDNEGALHRICIHYE